MKILVFGAGGVGSVFGCFLARTGHDVSLLGRPWHIDVIRQKGLVVTGIWGDYASKAFDLYTDAAALQKKAGSFDLILLTVKSPDTRRAMQEIAPLLGPKTTVLTLQNGLGNLETAVEIAGADRVLAGRVIFGVETKPGIAKVTVASDPTAIGAAPGGHPAVTPIQAANMISQAKIPAVAVADILPVLWAKVIYNCALNGICTLENIPYGRILDSGATRGPMHDVVHECYAVGHAEGVKLEPATADEFIKLLEARLIPQTAAHMPSMAQDLARGRRTDIDALNAAIAARGARHGIPTPENDRIARAIREKESCLPKRV